MDECAGVFAPSGLARLPLRGWNVGMLALRGGVRKGMDEWLNECLPLRGMDEEVKTIELLLNLN